MLISNTLEAKNERPSCSLNPKLRARLCGKYQQMREECFAPFVKALGWVPGAQTQVHTQFICSGHNWVAQNSVWPPDHLGCLLQIKIPAESELRVGLLENS